MKSSIEDRTVQAKTYQKPKTHHPWRQYKVWFDKSDMKIEAEEVPSVIPVKEFISDIINNWEKYEVTLSVSFEGSSRHLMRTLPQAKQAAWLAGTLKRIYSNGQFN